MKHSNNSKHSDSDKNVSVEGVETLQALEAIGTSGNTVVVVITATAVIIVISSTIWSYSNQSNC